MVPFIVAVVAILSTIALLPFVAYALARLDLVFTLLETGNIKYIYHGDTLYRIIADVKGKRLEDKHLASGEIPHRLVKGESHRPMWGIYWVGIPGIASVKRFKIHKKKEYETTAGKVSTEWIEDRGTHEVDSLRAVFPRPFLLTDMELKDGKRVSLMVTTKLAVVDAYIPFPEHKGDFFGNASSTLRAAIGDKIKEMTMDEFIQANKGEGGIFEYLTNGDKESDFNLKFFEKQVGLHLMGLSIPEWDPSDKEIRESMNLKFLAEKKQEAKLVDLETFKLVTAGEAEAKALANERLALAEGARVKAIRDNLAAPGGSPDMTTKATADVLRAEAQPNLTTLVEGGAPVVVGGGNSK